MARRSSSDPKLGEYRLGEWRSRVDSPSDSTRLNAVTLLEHMGSFAMPAATLLIGALSDRDPRIRRTAASALGHLRSHSGDVVAALVEATNDGSAEVRCSAVCAIGESRPRVDEVLPALLRRLADRDATVNSAAARAIGELGHAAASAVPMVAKLLVSLRGDGRDRGWIASSLSKLGPTAAPHLLQALDDRDDEVKSSAARGLGELGPAASAAVPRLVEALRDRTPLRTDAAGAIGRIGEQSDLAVPALVRGFTDEDLEFRRACVEAVGKFGADGTTAVPALVPFLAGTDWFRMFALEALGRIGPPAFEALEPIRRLVWARERTIREAAVRSICKISGAPLPADMLDRTPAPPGSNVFDFGRTKLAVSRMLREGIANFAHEYPDEEVACVALFGQGFGGSACLCLGTPAEVPDDLSYGGAYDFKFREYEHEVFDWWPDLYQVGTAFKIVHADGRTQRRSCDRDGNDAINKPLFDLLVTVLRESLPFPLLRKAKRFRVGVQVHDSRRIRFWTPDP